MKKYVARANALGLSPGDTFHSDDEFYTNLAKSGIIEEVDGGGVQGVFRWDVEGSGGDPEGVPNEESGRGGRKGKGKVSK